MIQHGRRPRTGPESRRQRTFARLLHQPGTHRALEAAVIYDALLAMDLPSELGPPLPTNLRVGLENLLFTGRWASRRANCTLSAAVVLARCCRAMGAIGCTGLTVRDDAGCVLDQTFPAAWDPTRAERWPEALPPAWQEHPCELQILGYLRDRGIGAAVTLRYTPRHDPEHGPLTGSLRALWDPRPDPGERDALPRSVEAALAGEANLRELGRRLQSRGEQLAAHTVRCLGDAFEGATGSTWGRVTVLHGYTETPARFGDRLAGVPEESRVVLAVLEARLASSRGRWPALDADGVHGHVIQGRFVPSAEVSHVA